MASTKQPVTRDRQLGGCNSTQRPHLLDDNEWVLSHNVKAFNSSIDQVPHKVVYATNVNVFEVLGCDATPMNGPYQTNGVVNGKMSYQNVANDFFITWDDVFGLWIISGTWNGINHNWATSTEDVVTPDLVVHWRPSDPLSGHVINVGPSFYGTILALLSIPTLTRGECKLIALTETRAFTLRPVGAAFYEYLTMTQYPI